MSLLFDQNLSRQLPSLLNAEFPGADQVVLAGLQGAADQEIWDHAAARGLTIVTKDADFKVLVERLGAPPKVIWLRVGNCPTRVIERLLRSHVAEIRAFLVALQSTLLELS